ncbi:MAG: HigA family addiction module antidote protein [Chloroflexi bacterium]|nr:HigA family addiction module antidote protein [Chloroflexota bacterium]
MRIDVPFPPGELLKEELEERGMTQVALARAMGRPLQSINAIIRGKKVNTADTALQLERVLGISAEYWLNLETRYQLTLARRRQEGRETAS